ncbi:hypothetical protein TcCL_Unassigned04448 [Trypanosoma cruzi]|nr:hypothetical protein TcCL_Unassigned04448 [Trypanosoma cruzi]
MRGACRCGEDSIPGTTRTSCHERRLCAKARCDSCPLLDMPAHALRIKNNPLCRWCRPFLTEVNGPPLPPPEPLPDVSTANPCRPASGGLTFSCPTCGRALVRPQYEGARPTCSAWRYNSLRRPYMWVPQWCQRLLNRRLAHRSPQKVPSMPAGKARRKHNRRYSR